MKYLALLSGGKDSCYNLVHCAQLGHELVAAASLGPEPGKEELDSYLYQTVGQDAIELVAQALEVPLYRRVIQGTAVEQGSEYGGRKADEAGGVTGDETEDLFQLLVAVKNRHPDVEGVSVGAILSNYQRVRVEHVCRRLNLTTLCFLWQRDQEELLVEMIDAGMEAILIKVAGIGLNVSHLGKTLKEMKPTLLKLNSLYGSHVCGEGGEYETFTLDCPLYRHTIKLIETEKVIHSDNDFATVAFLRLKSAELLPKSPTSRPAIALVPPLLEVEFSDVENAVQTYQNDIEESISDKSYIGHCHPELPLATVKRRGSWVVISNVQAPASLSEGDISVEEEVSRCFQILSERLGEQGLGLSQCVMINIYLSSMDLFGRVNAVYSTFFGTSPPARACVAVDLSEGIHVRLEVLAFLETRPSDRQALHVQGLSYWAPANIGPYSQAIIAGEQVFISGQIGLIPSSMTLPRPPSLATEFSLASQHVQRISSALQATSGGDWEGSTQLAIYWLTSFEELCKAKKGHLALRRKDYPSLFLVIKELPKGALIEKQVILHTGKFHIQDEDDNEPIIKKFRPTLSCRKPLKPEEDPCLFQADPLYILRLLSSRKAVLRAQSFLYTEVIQHVLSAKDQKNDCDYQIQMMLLIRQGIFCPTSIPLGCQPSPYVVSIGLD
ncbi:hypothetical protein CVT26_012644 [Gymnopilus dilepis]|uniref:Diphthine--ammonia ligase n=1 Tax=Gymnopilus dilepis TaxID=231916 RepID=A0A409YW29_9AGAR|nr:hypothetical protein CVT26_012644 [Gymnopilus dilepis]